MFTRKRINITLYIIHYTPVLLNDSPVGATSNQQAIMVKQLNTHV